MEMRQTDGTAPVSVMTLYHCVSARSFRALWALEELQVPYELRMLPFPPRASARWYLQINPLGTVPTFFDGDLRMTESAAICQYLGARHGPTPLAVEVGEADFGAYLNWLHFGEATLTFPQTLLLRYGRFEPAERRAPQVVEDYRRWFLGRLRILDEVLAQRLYLCGNRFTMADISVGYALMLAEYIGLAAQFSLLVTQYWDRIRLRPGFERACASQEQAALAQDVSPLPSPLCGG